MKLWGMWWWWIRSTIYSVEWIRYRGQRIWNIYRAFDNNVTVASSFCLISCVKQMRCKVVRDRSMRTICPLEMYIVEVVVDSTWTLSGLVLHLVYKIHPFSSRYSIYCTPE